jgi:hypothetical protein
MPSRCCCSGWTILDGMDVEALQQVLAPRARFPWQNCRRARPQAADSHAEGDVGFETFASWLAAAAAPAGQVSAACVERGVPEAEELFASTEALLGSADARWVPDPPS